MAAITISLVGLIASAWMLIIHRRVIRPFRRLESFATAVAAGELDTPLAMDRHNAFGAWTESFDLMRTELAAARAAERAAIESKQTIISQLSHDIRTPLASISASAELLRLHGPDAATDNRLQMIDTKCDQIQALMADLLQANASEVADLPVVLATHPSTTLTGLLRQADIQDRIRIGAIADALLVFDRARLQQVIDNVVTNSYKYAGTDIHVWCVIEQDMAALYLADHGQGVPADELEAIFGQSIRGSNADQVPGYGLGLFTCAVLMGRMGGAVTALPGDGFTIRIAIPLAR